jgi:hypothetical protein
MLITVKDRREIFEGCRRPREAAVTFRPTKDSACGLFYNQKLKIKNQKSPGTLEETLIHMEDPPKWLFLLEEGRFRRSKFSVSVRFYVGRTYEVFEYE